MPRPFATKERLEEGKQAADTIVTVCSICHNHMDKAARQERMGLEIIDLPILVAKAMGISLD